MKKILILGGPEFQIPVVEQAKKMGLYTVVVDISPDAVCSQIADEFYACSLKDYSGILKIAEAVSPDGITVGMVDAAVITASKVCAKLGLPGLSPDVAKMATDKYLMIDAFRAHNVPHPEYKILNGENLASIDIDSFATELGLPTIVKPVDSAGSRGIRLIHNKQEILEAIEESLGESESGSVLLEEFMTGPEVSVEMVVIDSIPYVLQVTDKMTSGAPYFMEIGHNQPSTLPLETIEQIKKVACCAALAVELTNSIVHAEIIITDDGPKMVELGARMGGDGIQEQLLELSSGINMPEISVKLALGGKIDFPESKIKKCSAVRFIQSMFGVVESVENVETARQIENIKYLKVYCKAGDEYKEAHDNSGRMGYVISQADSGKAASEACESAMRLIKITMR